MRNLLNNRFFVLKKMRVLTKRCQFIRLKYEANEFAYNDQKKGNQL